MSDETQEFDYVIVGSGASGSVIARRLVDAGAGSVAVLEAGGDDLGQERIQDPQRWRTLWGSDLDWCYKTVPQESLNGRRVDWPRGKVLGGSSSLNVMIYVRGHRMDYDVWEYLGCHGWGWDDVQPLFLRSEDHEDGASEFHGAGGPLKVSRIRRPNPIAEAFIAGAQSVGIPANHDFNGRTLFGAGMVDVTISGGKRASTATTFLRPVLDSVAVILDALVDKVRIENGRAVGVEYSVAGQHRVVRARTEVILAAGTLGSPAILLRSGIGPAEELARLSIPLQHHLPGVGENLQDHAIAPVVFEASKPLPDAGSQLMDAMLFAATQPSRIPDLQPVLMHFPKPMPGYPAVAAGYTLAAGIVRPQSRGNLRLASADPAAPPLIDPRYLSEPADLEALVDAIELCREIGNSDAFSEWREREIAPGRGPHDRDGLREYARDTCGTYHHQVGTCKMGIDRLAVVDPELRVHGIESLRVADASIMPVIPTVNTHAPSIMIGEKASDLILQSAGMLLGAGSVTA